MKFFEYIIEGFLYLGMVLAPLLGMGAVGGILFLWQRINNPNLAIGLWVVVGIIGLIWGIWFAEKYRRKMPPSMFWAQLMATPQLDYDAPKRAKEQKEQSKGEGKPK